MGSNSLDSGAHIAQTSRNFDAGPDLDDALIGQALSLYQSAREGGKSAGGFTAPDEQRLGCGLIPSQTTKFESEKTPTIVSAKIDKGNHLELTIDVPYKRDANDRYPWEVTESDSRMRVWDQIKRGPFDGPVKPYGCVSVREGERKPIDEFTVGCSSRVRITEEPRFGCSKRVKIDVDLMDFNLCSSHIKLKPDWVKAEDPRDDVYGCINRIDGKPKSDSIYACAARFDPREDNHARVFACAATAPKSYISEFLDTEERTRANLAHKLRNGTQSI